METTQKNHGAAGYPPKVSIPTYLAQTSAMTLVKRKTEVNG